jgi:hypothetical protein
MSKQIDQTNDRQGGILGITLRLFWMFFGNAVLFISSIFIFEHESATLHIVDAVFWITVAALILVRYLDIKFLGGLTATGIPATIANWRKYVALLLICSTAVWVISHAVNYLVVNR